MLNFTVGPVQMSEAVCKTGAEQIPYFRTLEFSDVMMENERLIKKFSYAEENARVLFLTGSGTAAMEASVINLFDEKDKVLIVNGGSFGQRFVQICQVNQIPYCEVKLEYGEILTEEMLLPFQEKGITGFLVNIHETSTGVYYDMDIIKKFCKQNNCFLVVDAISSFIADPFYMERDGVDVMLTGSQKALACPPGISIIVLSERAVKRVENTNCRSLYFDLSIALKDGERGQTPFTPAVGILNQLNVRLKEIDSIGLEMERKKNSDLAEDFRNKIQELPVRITSKSMSNALTPIHTPNASAYEIFKMLKDEYGIWVCPNGGVLADKMFRVGHIGNLTKKDNEILIEALKDIQRRGSL